MNNKEVVKSSNNGIVITDKDVINLFTSGKNKPDEKEITMFINLCKYQELNPFLNEVYLIKYSADAKASIVTSAHVFTKRAAKNPNYDGIESGVVILKKDGSIENRKGQIYIAGEILVGGWAEVYLKNRRVPVFKSVLLSEYKANSPFWREKPATMIEKVASAHAKREAFPDDFEGLYIQEELEGMRNVNNDKNYIIKSNSQYHELKPSRENAIKIMKDLDIWNSKNYIEGEQKTNYEKLSKWMPTASDDMVINAWDKITGLHEAVESVALECESIMQEGISDGQHDDNNI